MYLSKKLFLTGKYRLPLSKKLFLTFVSPRKRMSYDDIAACEDTANVDDLFDRWESEKNGILRVIHESPHVVTSVWNDPSRYSNDRYCSSYQLCPQCSNISHLSDSQRSFMVECGSRAGQKYNVSSYSTMPSTVVKESLKALVSRLLQINPEVMKCGTDSNSANLTYLASNPFANNLLVSWIVGDTLRNNNIPNREHVAIAYSCAGHSKLVVEDAKAVDSKLLSTPDQVSALIRQLVVVYHCLNENSLNHGNPVISSLKYDEKAIGYLYDGILVDCPFTLMLSNFSLSTISFGMSRLLPESSSKWREQGLLFGPLVKPASCQTGFCESNTYTITSKNLSLFQHMKYVGCPLFTGSLDLYCFLVSLACMPGVMGLILSGDSLRHTWSKLWTIKDRETIEKRVSRVTGQPDALQVLSLLKDLELRCDLLNVLVDDARG